MLDGDKTLSLVQPWGMLRDSDRTQKLRLPDAKPGRDQRCEKGVTNEMKSRGKGGKKAYPILCRAGWDYDLRSPSLTTQFWIKPASAPGVREGKICCAVSGDQQICQPRRGAARLKLTKKQKKKRGCEILACTHLEEAAKAAGQPGVLVHQPASCPGVREAPCTIAKGFGVVLGCSQSVVLQHRLGKVSCSLTKG